jgi:hypothetical protein
VRSDANTSFDRPYQTFYHFFISDIFIAQLSICDDIISFHAKQDLCMLLERSENLFLGLGIEAGKHSRSMCIVEKFSSDFQIQSSRKITDSIKNLFLLEFDIFVAVKAGLFVMNTL